MKPKVYDCFCYLNEDMLLTIRLETLWNDVDYFVICESAYTLSGHAKPLNFEIEAFSQYKEKIRYLVIDHFPNKKGSAWDNENYQRDFLAKGLYDATPVDLIIISDVDEIPRPESIALYNPKFIRGDFEQYYYSYFLNNLRVVDSKPFMWMGSKITTYKHFVNFFKGSAQSVRIYKSFGLLRNLKRRLFKFFQVQVLKEAGWHFTWVLNAEQIIYKIESFSHQELNVPLYKDPQKNTARILKGEDLFIAEYQYQVQPLDQTFPKYLVENTEKFQDWLLPK